MTERTATQIKAAKEALGRILVRHLAKIVVGLGTVLVLVWQLRGDVDARDHRLVAVETKTVEIAKRHGDDSKELRRGLRRIERKTDAILLHLGARQPPPPGPPP
jgi:uncharacterized protein HemX